MFMVLRRFSSKLRFSRKKAYRGSNVWQQFFIEEADLTGISQPTVDDIDGSGSVKQRFGLGGQHLSSPTKGINIVRMSNGRVRKVVVK